jgi:hypothetical protein
MASPFVSSCRRSAVRFRTDRSGHPYLLAEVASVGLVDYLSVTSHKRAIVSEFTHKGCWVPLGARDADTVTK